MSLVQFYKDYLTSLNVKVDEDGLLSFEQFGVVVPLEIDDRRLALPTKDVLQAVGQGHGVVPFHPMSESSNRGESTVLQMLKKLIRMRLNSSILGLFQELTELAADRTRHRGLSPDAHRVLSCLPEADEKTVDAAGRIIRAMSEDARRGVSIYLKRRGKLAGQDYGRIAVFKFPLYEEFMNADNTVVFGVKLRKKDFAGLKKLLEYILPDADDPETYAVGTNNLLVPYLDSLTQCYLGLARQINKIVRIHKNEVDAAALRIPVRWAGREIDWSAYRDEIPPLEDSMGVLLQTEDEAQRQKQRPAPKAAVQKALKVSSPPASRVASPAIPQPQETDVPWDTSPSAPTAHTSGPRDTAAALAARPAQKSGKSIDDVLQERMGIPGTPPVYQPAHHATPMGYAAPGYPVPGGYPAQYAPRPAAARPGDYPGRVRGAAVAPSPYGYTTALPGYAPVGAPVGAETAGAYAVGQSYYPGTNYAPPRI